MRFDISIEELTKFCQSDYSKHVQVLQVINLGSDLESKSKLENCLFERQSVREFSSMPIKYDLFLRIITFAIGPGWNGKVKKCNYPSGGALYPLEFYFVIFNIEGLTPGIYYLNQIDHSLQMIWDDSFHKFLEKDFSQQGNISTPAFAVLIRADFYKHINKYGSRGMRFTLMEAGHVMQNFYLLAANYGVGIVALGGFQEKILNKIVQADGVSSSIIYAAVAGNKKDEQ